ncbi:MAG TPA: HAD family phosphatase [Pseudonocardiaceae bacterium]|jgi:putative hydrolase of the HAD superfamily
MGIRAVVFDIGDVLEVDTEPPLIPAWADRTGLPVEELVARLGPLWAGGAIGTITETQVLAGISERLGISSAVTDELMAGMWAGYLGRANTELIDYCRALRPRYRTGILSNSFVGAREREQAAYGFAELVDDIVYSHEVGISKPDPAIYRLSCARLDVAPHETIFVDDRADNVEAASELGMMAILHRANKETIARLDEAVR